jgi:S-adenosylmethionine hydrolase
MTLVSFLSDFGLHDPYVGEVKGVIRACGPEIEIIDVTHGIEPGNLEAASFVLLSSYRYFSEGTLQLAVIDPGVGGSRDIVVVETKSYTFVGPDNGILFEAVREDGVENIHALDTERFVQRLGVHFPGNSVIRTIAEKGISSTFHGRDLFAPLAGYLLTGGPLRDVTWTRESMVELEVMNPVEQGDKIMGRVVYVDRFGNLISNVRAGMVGPEDEIFLKTAKKIISVGTLKKSYSQVSEGAFLSYIGSRNCLEIAVNRGSARDFFGAAGGDSVLILKKPGGDNAGGDSTAGQHPW